MDLVLDVDNRLLFVDLVPNLLPKELFLILKLALVGPLGSSIFLVIIRALEAFNRSSLVLHSSLEL